MLKFENTAKVTQSVTLPLLLTLSNIVTIQPLGLFFWSVNLIPTLSLALSPLLPFPLPHPFLKPFSDSDPAWPSSNTVQTS